MALTTEEVKAVAELARLHLSPEELERMRDQLSLILDHIAALDELDTAAISPTAQVIELTNIMRDDIVTPSLSQEAVLANAPRQSDGFFEVHAVLTGSDEVES
jgi:aspartyl-tRNA(Asn)/glutamyl-tRNA(Gln) amidotransferase subunit C